MLTIRTNDKQCINPRCRCQDVKIRTADTMICCQCGETWKAEKESMRGTKVEITTPNSIWTGMKGYVVEVIDRNNIRVTFNNGLGDIFHPAYLKEVP